jgi:iron complex outermembrane receptor protein
VSNEAVYAQLGWRPGPAWYLYGGLRRSRVRFQSSDLYLTPDNPDDSGAVEFAASTPVFGASVQLRPGLHLYASVGRGLETPTFDELGYRPDGSAGLNFALRPSRSHSHELGVKLDGVSGAHAELAAFRADTRDELAVASNSGGRSTYHNVGHARREGLELSADLPLGERARVQAAYTWLHAWYRDDFRTCASSPCGEPTALAPAGTPIPGLPRSALNVSVRIGEQLGWYGRLNAQALSSVPVANTGGQRTAGFAVFGASLGYAFEQPRVDGRLLVAVENAFDRHYAGSVIVNESNGRYFEPAAGRTWLLGVELRWHQEKPPQGGGE